MLYSCIHMATVGFKGLIICGWLYLKLSNVKARLYVQYEYVILPYVNRTLTSLYDENKLCVSYLQSKFTKVSTECVIDSR